MILPSPPALLALLLLGLLSAGPARAVDLLREPPVPVRTVAPEYPAAQLHAGVNGLVTVRCTISVRGDVVDTEVVKVSDPAFEHPAVAAVQRWKFKPATQDGVPVAATALIPVKFVAAR